MLDLLGERYGPAYEEHFRRGTKFPEVVRYGEQLVLGVEAQRDYLDDLICKVARNWKLDRMATIDRNIIRMALYEMLIRDDIPAKVAINEAVELGKRYGDSESGAFVNGILDRIRIDLQVASDTRTVGDAGDKDGPGEEA